MRLQFEFVSPEAADVYGGAAPTRGSSMAAGYDLRAVRDKILAPGERALVPTGLKVALHTEDVDGLPLCEGITMSAMVLPRSGLAIRYGVTVLNAPGLVDADYRGEIGVVLINHGDQPFMVTIGDRIAQLAIVPIGLPSWQLVDSVNDTQRGAGGFGSTGL
jgi:dUTP pyrophosphatase